MRPMNAVLNVLGVALVLTTGVAAADGLETPDESHLAALAEPVPAPAQPETWVGSGQGGLLITSGNTPALTINGKLDLSHSHGGWKQAVFASALYGRNQGQMNGERGEFRYQLDRQIEGRNYWFTGLDAVRDLFSGYSFRATVSTGLGRRFVDSDTAKLSANVGIGYEVFAEQDLIRDDSGNLIGRVNGPTVHGIAATFGLKGERRLTANTSLQENLAITSATGNTSIASDLALHIGLGNRLALSVGYDLRASTNPPLGAKKIDQGTTLNVVYALH